VGLLWRGWGDRELTKSRFTGIDRWGGFFVIQASMTKGEDWWYMMAKIKVLDRDVSIYAYNEADYICLTDIPDTKVRIKPTI